MHKLSGRGTAIVGTALVMLGAIGPADAALSASSDLPRLGDVPLYRVNVTANGIQPGPGPTGRPELARRADVGDMHMIPILVDGRLIVGTNDGHLVALDARTGTTRWDAALGGDVIQPALASADGLVYANDTKAVYAVDLDSGSQRWWAPVGTVLGRLNAVDGVVYIGVVGASWASTHGPVPRSGAGRARRMSPSTPGRSPMTWATSRPVTPGCSRSSWPPSTRCGGSRRSATAWHRGRSWRYVLREQQPERGRGAGGGIYAVDRAPGEVRWRFRAPSGLQLKEGPAKDGVLYASGTDDGIWALRDDGSSVTVLWHVDAPAAHWPMSMVGTTLYEVRLDESVGAHDSADGSLIWETDPVGDIAGGPIVSGGMVFVNNDAQGEIRKIAVAPDGRVYVADGSNHRIQAFAPDGTYLFQFGSFGTGDGQFGAVNELAIASDGSVFGGLEYGPISKFTPDGKFLWRVPNAEHAYGYTVRPDGALVATCDQCRQLLLLDASDGHLRQRLDEPQMDGDGFGPVEVDPDGNMYVQIYAGSPMVFDPAGRFLGATLYTEGQVAAPVFLPDGRGYLFGHDGLLELQVTLPVGVAGDPIAVVRAWRIATNKYLGGS